MYSVEDLKRSFVKKLDDDLFAVFGGMNGQTGETGAPHLPVWAGYERLVDSVYSIGG